MVGGRLRVVPLYAYLCDSCGSFDSQHRSNYALCPACGLSSRRNWAFRRAGTSFRPHFNHAVGEYVESDHQFREALKRSGGEASTSYTPVYPGDISPRGDTEVLERQARHWHDKRARGDMSD